MRCRLWILLRPPCALRKLFLLLRALHLWREHLVVGIVKMRTRLLPLVICWSLLVTWCDWVSLIGWGGESDFTDYPHWYVAILLLIDGPLACACCLFVELVPIGLCSVASSPFFLSLSFVFFVNGISVCFRIPWTQWKGWEPEIAQDIQQSQVVASSHIGPPSCLQEFREWCKERTGDVLPLPSVCRDVAMKTQGSGEFRRHFECDKHWIKDLIYMVHMGLSVLNRLMEPMDLTMIQMAQYWAKPFENLGEEDPFPNDFVPKHSRVDFKVPFMTFVGYLGELLRNGGDFTFLRRLWGHIRSSLGDWKTEFALNWAVRKPW